MSLLGVWQFLPVYFYFCYVLFTCLQEKRLFQLSVLVTELSVHTM